MVSVCCGLQDRPAGSLPPTVSGSEVSALRKEVEFRRTQPLAGRTGPEAARTMAEGQLLFPEELK